MKRGYDFAGYATRNDVRCTDGTVIRKGCFSAMDGQTVPMVYQHNHTGIDNVIGHAELEERPDGMYCYAYCNDTDAGRTAKEIVRHGDVNAFSIWANQIKRNRSDILHGEIKEVSLVLSGADRTALIDTIVEHDDTGGEQAEIQFLGGYAEMISHSDLEKDEDDEDEDKNKNKESQDSVAEEKSDKEKKKMGADDNSNASGKERTVQDVLDTFNDEQKKVLEFIVGKAIEDAKKGTDKSDTDKDDEEDTEVKHNVFDSRESSQNYISHDDMVALINKGKKIGSLKDAFEDAKEEGVIAHADYDGMTAATGSQQYGFNDPEFLFPDAKTLNTTPEFIKRNTDWVEKVMSGTHHTPFSRVKSIFADITEDQARAKGYIKGKQKKEEVFSLLKRTTDPQTVYKKQKMDKDDIDDITDFNVIVWIKAEMQGQLREEVARAILIGDGRLADDDDKIKEDHIRPVFNDVNLFTIKVPVEIPANADESTKAKALMRAAIKARKDYKGSGNPSFYSTDDELTNMLLIENGIGERLYKSESEVATAIRAKEIVTVEPMEGLQIEIDEGASGKKKYPVAGTMVNLVDYNIGTNGGAKTDFFDDFDIDFNQYKYLYETRMSGALIKPFSAITFYYKTAAAAAGGKE